MAGGGSHGGGGGSGGGGGGPGGPVAGALAAIFKLAVVIGLGVALCKQVYVALGGDPKDVGAIQSKFEERTGRKPGTPPNPCGGPVPQNEHEMRMREIAWEQGKDPCKLAEKRARRQKAPVAGTKAVAVASRALSSAESAKARQLGISDQLYGRILRSSAKYEQPAGVLYAFKLVESGRKEYSTGGTCSAYAQYAIRDRWLGNESKRHRKYNGRWYKNGEANKLALQEIAGRFGFDPSAVVGSCGKSTMEVRGDSFGGCLWDGQITPIEWVNNPEFRERDPRDPQAALDWIAYRMRNAYNKAIANGKSHEEARHASILQYPGAPKSYGSWKYYVKKNMPKWRRWNEVHGIAERNDQIASN